MNRVTYRAMNCDVELFDCGPNPGARLARCGRWLHAFEARFSRFLSTSEVTRLNQRAGESTRISPLLLRLLCLSLELAHRSDGLFDPTILNSLEEVGYDRSFEDIEQPRPGENHLAGSTTWRDAHVDRAARNVRLPPLAGIDLGGIAKGWAVDRLVDYLGPDCLVNAGGDLYAAGAPDDAESWLVGLQDPFDEARDIMTLAVRDRGIATSSRLKRRWMYDGQAANHLIDPRTRASSASDAVQVTAIAASASLAEYHAKVALLLGVSAGLDYLDGEAGVEGVIVAESGLVLSSAGLDGFRVDPAWRPGMAV